MAGAPNIVGGYRISWAEGTTANTKPSDATWNPIEGAVNKLPNFFPTAEATEYRVLDSKQALAIPGAMPSIDGTMSIYLNTEFVKEHQKMVVSQKDPTKGNSIWLKVEFVDDKRIVYCKCQINEKIPTPTDESGGLFLYEFQLTNVAEPIDEWTLT